MIIQRHSAPASRRYQLWQRTGEPKFIYVNNSPIETQIIDGNPDKREFTYYQLTYGHSLPKTVTVRYGQRTQHS